MRGRLGALIGFAAGYVLGSKAGQERYEEIRNAFNQLMGTEPAQQLQAEVRNAADKASGLLGEKAGRTMAKADRLSDGNGDGNASDGAPSASTIPPA